MSKQGVVMVNSLINIVDEDLSITDIMAALVDAHGFDVATYNNAEDFLASKALSRCSISFVSFGLPRNGVQRILDLMRDGLAQTVVVITSDGVDTKEIVNAIKCGAENVLEKPFTIDQILDLITQIESQPKPAAIGENDLPATIASQLTAEEQRILVMIEQGVTVKQIAMRLDASIRTIHYRKAAILSKTNCKSCSEVVSKVSALRTLAGGVRRPMLLDRGQAPFSKPQVLTSRSLSTGDLPAATHLD